MMRLILILGVIFFNFSCKQKIKNSVTIDYKSKLQQANKQIVKANSNAIDAYVLRHNWTVEETGTGLRYFVYEHGSGAKINLGSTVLLEYSLQLLDGTILIDAKNPTTKTMIVGKENAESGIHEVLTYLKIGDKSKIILPPHLAFGLTGFDKIPPMATLVYDLKIKK